MVSQRERLEDIQNYAETLEELKFNSKPHISTLTELARDYGKNRQGREVIEIIKKRIVNKETPITQKNANTVFVGFHIEKPSRQLQTAY
jgi:hypothetical protein